MKKTKLFLALSAIVPFLSGCNGTPVKITYGSLIEVNAYTASSLYLLSNADLLSKVESTETFLLAATTSSSCTCWSKTCESIAKISNEHHLRFYTFVGKTSEEVEKYNVSSGSDPIIYLVSKGKVKLKLSTSNKSDIVYDSSKLYEEISKISTSPSMMYINEDYLLNHFINGTDSGVVTYVQANCGDCKYCLPNVMQPFFEENTSKKDLVYLYDIEYLKESEEYLTKKKSYYLADTLPNGDPNSFGYSRGFVPTSQYWSNGKLVSMNVYFNDSLEEQMDGNYIVKTSYYSNARLSSLDYLDGIETKVLEGVKVNKDDTNYGYWKSEKAAQYHDPILKAFLNKYIK